MPRDVFNRNEGWYGPSPAARRTLRAFSHAHTVRYIDGYHTSILVPGISKTFKIQAERVALSYGAEDFLRSVISHIPKGGRVLVSDVHYGYYSMFAGFRGLNVHTFRMRHSKHSYAFDVNDAVSQIKKFKPQLVLLTSPNNPTGNSLSTAQLRKIGRATPKTSLIVVDEAYWGFDAHYSEKAARKLLDDFPNLALARTFSKLYALAGLRIGFALCGKSFKTLAGYQDRYLGTSRVLEQTALAALNSTTYYRKHARDIARTRDALATQVNQLKHFRALDSKANFLLIHFDTVAPARLESALGKLNPVTSKRVNDHAFRVTITTRAHASALLRALKKLD